MAKYNVSCLLLNIEANSPKEAVEIASKNINSKYNNNIFNAYNIITKKTFRYYFDKIKTLKSN